MKQSGTIEDYFMMYNHSRPKSNANDHEVTAEKRQSTCNERGGQQTLPGKQVIRNILNYSRALTVLQLGDDEHLFILNN